MNDSTRLDRIRALAERRLSAEEDERLRRELAADPELARLAEDFGAVHAVTAVLADDGPACRTSFDDLARAAEREPVFRRRWTRRVAAAAAVALLAAAAWYALAPAAAPAVVLGAIELDAAPAPAPVPEPPPGLAHYDPRGPGGVAWLDDFQAASWLSAASGRPLLVFGEIRGCPMCAKLDVDVFTARSVVDLIERYVPVRFDLDALPREEADALMRRGYPFLEVWSDRLEPIRPLSRQPDPAFFAESMRDGLAAADAEGEVASWDELRSLARTLDRARERETAGLFAGALDGYRALAGGASEPFRRLGDCGLARIAADARGTLLHAREVARSDPGGAEEVLRRALQRYAGTDYAADLRAVLERLRDSGRFPAVTAGAPRQPS